MRSYASGVSKRYKGGCVSQFSTPQFFFEMVKFCWTSLDFEGGASNRTPLQWQALQALRVLQATKQATRQDAGTVCSVEVSSAVGRISNDIICPSWDILSMYCFDSSRSSSLSVRSVYRAQGGQCVKTVPPVLCLAWTVARTESDFRESLGCAREV